MIEPASFKPNYFPKAPPQTPSPEALGIQEMNLRVGMCKFPVCNNQAEATLVSSSCGPLQHGSLFHQSLYIQQEGDQQRARKAEARVVLPPVAGLLHRKTSLGQPALDGIEFHNDGNARIGVSLDPVLE